MPARAAALILLGTGALAGCASLPQRQNFVSTGGAYPAGTLAPAFDGRARFREIFCRLAEYDNVTGENPAPCDGLLWRLADERRPEGAPATLPTLPGDLRVFVVSGAFGDCRKLDTVPFGDEITRLSAEGVRIQAVMVSGRSSASHNSRQIAEAIESAGVAASERIVLVGYSKGAVDALQLLVDYPDIARQVAVVVSVAGPILGTPLADGADWWYRTFLTKAFVGVCDPGDGGVIADLRSDVRREWFGKNALPRHVQYLSLAAFTTESHLARGLRLPWRLLAEKDRRNDGQVLIEDAVIPQSTLLGYANADHWDVAIAVERQMPYLSGRESPRLFPRGWLLDAILLYATERAGHAALAQH